MSCAVWLVSCSTFWNCADAVVSSLVADLLQPATKAPKRKVMTSLVFFISYNYTSSREFFHRVKPSRNKEKNSRLARWLGLGIGHDDFAFGQHEIVAKYLNLKCRQFRPRGDDADGDLQILSGQRGLSHAKFFDFHQLQRCRGRKPRMGRPERARRLRAHFHKINRRQQRPPGKVVAKNRPVRIQPRAPAQQWAWLRRADFIYQTESGTMRELRLIHWRKAPVRSLTVAPVISNR